MSRLSVLIRYAYIVGEDYIDVRADNVEMGEGGQLSYNTYRQLFESGRPVGLEVYEDASSYGAPILRFREVYQSDDRLDYRRQSVDGAPGDEPYSERVFVRGRKVSSWTRLRDDTWDCQGSAVWPSTWSFTFTDKERGEVTRVFVYEYEFDDRGNWTVERSYELVDGVKTPSTILRRQIEYY